MYVAQFNRVDAIDARSGNIIWQFQTQQVSTAAQRGTAVHGNKVFVTTTDSKLVALDARTGATVWEASSAGERYRFAGQAPLVAKGKVSDGNQQFGLIRVRCRAGKISGPERHSTVGKDPAPTLGRDSWKRGGNRSGQRSSIRLNTIFYGTASQVRSGRATCGRRTKNPLHDAWSRAMSIPAVKWYFQFTQPMSVTGIDRVPVPSSRSSGASRRKLLVRPSQRLIHGLDRTTDAFRHGTPLVSKLNGQGLRPKGADLLRERASVKGSLTCPALMARQLAVEGLTRHGIHVGWRRRASSHFPLSDRRARARLIRIPTLRRWRFFLPRARTRGIKVWDPTIGHSYVSRRAVTAAASSSPESPGDCAANDARSGKHLGFNTGSSSPRPVSYASEASSHRELSGSERIRLPHL